MSSPFKKGFLPPEPNMTTTGSSHEKTLHELFAEQAVQTPDRIAMVGPCLEHGATEAEHVSYGELDKRAETLAHILRHKGVAQGSIVAVLLNRSIEMITGILGILKAGACYLPIEPGTPAIRVATMLEDCQVALVLTSLSITDTIMTTMGLNGTYSFTSLQALTAKKANPCRTLARSHYSTHATTLASPPAKILLLELSMLFSPYHGMYAEEMELPPAFAVPFKHLLRQMAGKITGKIARSGLDFADYDGLNEMVAEFQPDIICVSTLPVYKDLLHQTVCLLRHWGFVGPLLAAGSYAAEEWELLLQDLHIDLAMVNQDKKTFTSLIEEILANNNRMPDETVLEQIPNLAFMPRQLRTGNPHYLPREIVLMDKIVPAMAVPFAAALLPEVNHADPAYVMYTSGSTGKPKGTWVTHGNVFFTVLDTLYLKITPLDRILQLSNYAFDASIFDIFATLLNGGCLVLPDNREDITLERLADLLIDQKITVLLLTTPLFNAMVDAKIESFAGLRKILFGGEQVSLPHTQKALHYLGSNKILHMYGLTETTVYATYYAVEKSEAWGETIPIGVPLTHTTLYLLDSHLKPVPTGIPGQMCIGGGGVSPGYVNDPEQTAEKFIGSPFKRGERLYLSGDLGRKLPDGNIEFVGRTDQQVKIRGFRIEPREIENCLLQIHSIQKALVVAREPIGGERCLCAYIVPNLGQYGEFDMDEVKGILAATLPEYMIPSHLVILAELPLNANGKANLLALPEPWAEENSPHLAPTNGVEEKFVEIWEEVLGIERNYFGIESNFFRLCNHSRKVAILRAKLQHAFDVIFPIAELFKKPTIKELAHWLTTSEESTYASIPVVEQQEYYDLSLTQHWAWTLEQEAATSISFNLPMVRMLAGKLDIPAMARAFFMLVERHESLRTVITAQQGIPKQTILSPEEVDFNLEYIDFTTQSDSQSRAATWVQNEAVTPFNLNTGPLLKVFLLRVDMERHVIFMNLHHMVGDLISIDVLTMELFLLYDAFAHGLPNPLPPLRIQYKDYTVWHNTQLKNESFRLHREYWLNLLKGPLPKVQWPLDNTRSVLRPGNGAHGLFPFPAPWVERVNTRVESQRVNMKMTLLTALNILFFHYTGQKDIILGWLAVGRENTDLLNQVGHYANTLPLRTRLNANDTIAEVQQKVRLTLGDSEKHAAYPFHRLTMDMGLPLDANQAPIFTTLLDFRWLDTPPLTLPGVTDTTDYLLAEPFALPTLTTPFDLTIRLTEIKQAMTLHFLYNSDLFQPTTIQRMAQEYFHLLEIMLEKPGTKISTIAPISPAHFQ